MTGPSQRRRNSADAFPVEGGVERLGCPGGERAGIGHALGMAHDIAEEAALGLQHLEAPADLGGEVQDRRRRQLGRRAQAVLDVLVALTHDLQIDRDDQRGTLGILGPREQALHEIVVAQRVDLEPERGLGMAGDILDRADREGREREGDAEFLGRAGGLDLAIGRLHPAKSHGARATGIAYSCPTIFALVERLSMSTAIRWRRRNLVEIGTVVAEGLFGPTAGLGVVVEHLGHAALVDALEVLDLGDLRHDAKLPFQKAPV